VLIFSEESLLSGEKIASLQILRPESEGFKQNLEGDGKGWIPFGNPSLPWQTVFIKSKI